MQYLVTKALLELHDKYDGDLGLLDEPWASKQDREAFSKEQMKTLGEYVDKLHLVKVDCLPPELRIQAENRIRDLEDCIASEVILILKDRATPST